MIIDKPNRTEPLRQLWKQAFGDTDAFLNNFFQTGYSPHRCRQISLEGEVVAALYWFDCSFSGKKLAYLYAIATAQAYQGRGLCRMLMTDTHRHLQSLGYDGALLVPAKESLFAFYQKLGYHTCCHIGEFSCKASQPIDIKFVTAEDYMRLRQAYLPAGSVMPEESMLNFLKEQYFFYVGDAFALCATAEGDTLIATEFLGDPAVAPAIVATMGKKQGRFRTIGSQKSFAMYYPLSRHLERPSYFPFALD